jgi:hypothetical protein
MGERASARRAARDVFGPHREHKERETHMRQEGPVVQDTLGIRDYGYGNCNKKPEMQGIQNMQRRPILAQCARMTQL